MPNQLALLYRQRQEHAKENRERVLTDLATVYPTSKRYRRIVRALKRWEIMAGLWEGRALEIEMEEERKNANA